MMRGNAGLFLFASLSILCAPSCAGSEDETFADSGANTPDAAVVVPVEAGPSITTPSPDAGTDVAQPVCGSFLLEAKPVPATVIVAFDQSDSMSDPFTNGVPKSMVAKDAVLAALTPLAASLQVGAAFYPTSPPKHPIPIGSEPCPPYLVAPMSDPHQIALTNGTDFLAKWEAHFQPPWHTISSTPLNLAVAAATTVFLDPSLPPGAKALVVVGDGAPTCEASEDQITAPISQLKSFGIPTYVIALVNDLSSPLALLHAAAIAGGTEYARTPKNVGELTLELSKIIGSTIDECQLTFDPPPPNADEVHLIAYATGQEPYEILLGSDWTLSDDGVSVELTGDVCENAKKGAYEKLEFIFGCPDTIVK